MEFGYSGSWDDSKLASVGIVEISKIFVTKDVCFNAAMSDAVYKNAHSVPKNRNSSYH